MAEFRHGIEQVGIEIGADDLVGGCILLHMRENAGPDRSICRRANLIENSERIELPDASDSLCCGVQMSLRCEFDHGGLLRILGRVGVVMEHG